MGDQPAVSETGDAFMTVAELIKQEERRRAGEEGGWLRVLPCLETHTLNSSNVLCLSLEDPKP